MGQLLRCLDHQCYIMISPDLFVPESRNPLSLQTHSGICLGSGLHFVNHFTIHSIYDYLTAKCCDRIRYRNIGINIIILSLENRMTSYNHFYQQITSWSAVSTRFTLLPDPDALPDYLTYSI